MKKVLIVDATGRTSNSSKTKYLSDKILEQINLKQHTVTYLNLYKCQLPFVDLEILASRNTKTYKTDNQVLANKIVNQFEASDIIVFIYPVWNWSVPAILKTYIDLIMISNRNFKYEGLKIVGLLENKKALFINTGGGPLYGSLVSKVFNLANPNLYMKQLMNTVGIKETKTLAIGGMSYRFKNKQDNIKFDFTKYQTAVDKLVSKNKDDLDKFFA